MFDSIKCEKSEKKLEKIFEESLKKIFSGPWCQKKPGSGSALTKNAGSGSALKLMRIHITEKNSTFIRGGAFFET